MINEVAHTLPVLFILIIVNIISGTVNSLTVQKVQFDKKKMIYGIVKAMVAIVSVFTLAYVFDTIDLSGIGFTPMTIISTGIIVYACKLSINIVKILGLDSYIKITNPLDKK